MMSGLAVMVAAGEVVHLRRQRLLRWVWGAAIVAPAFANRSRVRNRPLPPRPSRLCQNFSGNCLKKVRPATGRSAGAAPGVALSQAAAGPGGAPLRAVAQVCRLAEAVGVSVYGPRLVAPSPAPREPRSCAAPSR